MIEADLRTFVLAQPPIVALIGDRFSPAPLPQGSVLPAVTYQRIAGASLFDHDGRSNLGRARIQINCWGPAGNTGYQTSVDLAETIRKALSGYRGPMGTNPATNARVINVIDVPEPDTKLWRRIVEISLWHQED